jgi:TPR repeat protein
MDLFGIDGAQVIHSLFSRARGRRIQRTGAATIAAAGRVSLLALGLIVAGAAWQATDAAARHALVIGNGAYPFQPLDNPRNDARAIAGVLGELGFDVLLLEDASLAKFAAGVQRLQASLAQGDTALFYYAGHGVQYRGINYLLPTDIRLHSPADLPSQAPSLNQIMTQIQQAKVGMTIVILDACRNNPFGAFADAFGNGLANVERGGSESLIAYATAAGEAALDGAGGNSPFTAALVTALGRPNTEIFDLFRQVRGQVREATDGLQLPWISGSLEHEFYFNQPAARVAGSPPPPARSGPITVASVLWNEIRNSNDPADFDAFVGAFPSSPMAGAASERRQVLVSRGAEAHPLSLPAPAAPPLPGSLESYIRPCDLVAADDQDPLRVAPAVRTGLVNTRLAIRTCAQDLAREPDNPRLLFQLGRALDIAERFDEARHFYEQAAAADYAAAYSNLAYMYLTGRGVARDDVRSAELYRQAALRGNDRGRVGIARAYREGWGVAKSYVHARSWLELAVDNYWPNAMDNLALYYREGLGVAKDPARAFDLYRRAADLGQTAAMDNLGTMYANGEYVAKDPVEANKWFATASKLGNRHGTFHLALAYLNGSGMAQDPAEALRLFELAAARGYPRAETEIGTMYRAGLGVAADPAEALFRYRIASAMGDDKGRRLLDELLPTVAPAVAAGTQARAEEWLRLNGG